MLPIVLKADAMAQQALIGNYNSVLMVGASQTSIWGDRSYGITGMLFDNLKQWGLSANTSKVTLGSDYRVVWIDGFNAAYMRNYGTNAVSMSASRMKPIGKNSKYGTVGIGMNASKMWSKEFGDMLSWGYNILYTHSTKIGTRINYAPALIFSQSPITYLQGYPESMTSRDQIHILANSFTINITKKFTLNVNWTIIHSTNEYVPILNSFMIGSKIPL